MPEDLVVEVREMLGYAVLSLSGRLSLRTSPKIREATVKLLLSTSCVVIDVSRVRVLQTAFLSVFPAALAAVGGWPSARLILFGAGTDLHSMLVSSRVTETVPLAADLASALAMLGQRPPELRRHQDLPFHDTAPSAARLFVRETCDVWLVPLATREVAEFVCSELVSNAVEHAQSSSQLTLTRSALRVSVRDFHPTTPPRPQPIDINAFRGRGLHLVVAMAQAWGVDPHPDGKTIWASLHLETD